MLLSQLQGPGRGKEEEQSSTRNISGSSSRLLVALSILGTNKLHACSSPSQGVTQGIAQLVLMGMGNQWGASRPV